MPFLRLLVACPSVIMRPNKVRILEDKSNEHND